MSSETPIIFDHRNDDVIMPAYVLVDSVRLRFNKAATEMCGIKVGKKIHLAYFGNYQEENWIENLWFFYVDDDKNGVNIKKEGRAGSMMQNMPIASKFLRHVKAAMPNRAQVTSIGLLIEHTKKEWNGKKLWKINIFSSYTSARARIKR